MATHDWRHKEVLDDFTIDRQGNLAFAQYDKTMSDIPKDRDVLKLLDGLMGL